MKEQEWVMFRTMFSAVKSSDDKYVCVMAIRHPEKTFSFLVAEMKATFTLAPDLLILRHSTSSFGGMFTEEKTEIKSIPHYMSEADVSSLTDYFDMIAFD